MTNSSSGIRTSIAKVRRSRPSSRNSLMIIARMRSTVGPARTPVNGRELHGSRARPASGKATATGEPEVRPVVPAQLAIALEPAQQHVDAVQLAGEVDQQRSKPLELGAGLLHLGQELVEPRVRGLELRQPAERGVPTTRR